jgi:hypothetical protein
VLGLDWPEELEAVAERCDVRGVGLKVISNTYKSGCGTVLSAGYMLCDKE